MRSFCPAVGCDRSLALPRASRSAHLSVKLGAAFALLLGVASPTLAQAPGALPNSRLKQSPALTAPAHPYAGHVAEAAHRFGIPEAWIWSVMRLESAGNPTATSHAGAMGLMQVMPRTYAELRARYGLGPDPYDRRDNILAGAAYLREMHDRYGATGMLAAYNAGPGRWEDYVTRGRPLPAETIAYMARLGAAVGGSAAPLPTIVANVDRLAWRRAALFVALDERTSSGGPESTIGALDGPATVQTHEPSAVPTRTPDTLFAIRRPE
jgi:soluble lytic murein transglycosylase-like protein